MKYGRKERIMIMWIKGNRDEKTNEWKAFEVRNKGKKNDNQIKGI